jgi:methionyl-tRNA formyltransferase
LYEKVNQKSVELVEAHLSHLADRVIEDVATPQEEFEGERYFYSKDSLAGLKRIRPEDLTDTRNHLKLYDRIRALDFPPFEPAYIELEGKKVHLTKAGDSFYAQ